MQEILERLLQGLNCQMCEEMNYCYSSCHYHKHHFLFLMIPSPHISSSRTPSFPTELLFFFFLFLILHLLLSLFSHLFFLPLPLFHLLLQLQLFYLERKSGSSMVMVQNTSASYPATIHFFKVIITPVPLHCVINFISQCLFTHLKSFIHDLTCSHV